MKICIIGALPSSLINFRGELIKSFLNEGHEVIAIASGSTEIEIDKVEQLGVKYIDYSVQRNGLNPLSDIITLLNFRHIFDTERPDIVLAYTIKPVIWGGIAAKFFPSIKFYGLITGLGFAFQKGDFKRSVLTAIVKILYRFSLSSCKGVIFQNPDNLNVFTNNNLVDDKKTHLVNGSGVDLCHYQRVALSKKAVFLLVARLLGDKGIREYAKAAKIVKKLYPDAIFQLLGPEDPSPDGISIREVNQWNVDGYVDYLGEASDVRPYINNCSIFVLPSYHEGLPRTVLEAMSTGRPILTTNVPGCRETVVNGKNGFLVEKENVEELAEKMIWFIEHPEQWIAMADASYEIAKEKFDVNNVNRKLIKIMGLNS